MILFILLDFIRIGDIKKSIIETKTQVQIQEPKVENILKPLTPAEKYEASKNSISGALVPTQKSSNITQVLPSLLSLIAFFTNASFSILL